jgi:4-amino-4-deoxy-L-arabinose transferase-like glycosyltransferase
MLVSARVCCSRFPAGSVALSWLTRARRVAHGATATGLVSRLAIAISILAIAVRLIFINQPYIDHWSWRQSDVAAIARNFSDKGFHFAYPQIDWAGNSTGYVGTEFPILPFLAAICYKFAGVREWIGRSQAVILFGISLPFFFLLVREIFGGAGATWATFFYAFTPLNVFAGRSFMPDVPSLSLALIGLYFFLRWVQGGKSLPLLLASVTISLSILIKVTSVVIGAPLLFVVFQKWRWNFVRRPELWLFAAVALLPSVAWYWHAYQIAEKFYPHHLFGEGGIRIENFSWYWKIAHVTATSSLTPVLSTMAIIGLLVPQSRDRRYSGLFHWWLAAMLLFVVAAGYGNRHPWYQLSLVPIAAALAGAACAFISSKIASCAAVAVFSILFAGSFAVPAYLYVRPLYESSAAQLRDAGLELSKITPPDALIVAADTGDPTIFYYAKRKGWHFVEQDGIYDGNPSDSQQAIVDLERLRTRGATHLVFAANTFWWLEYYPEFSQHVAENSTLMEANRLFKIYKLNPAAE